MENPNLENNNEMPEKFPLVMGDFLRDLSTTFPEFANLWEHWLIPGENMKELFNYCFTVYPERFFDILYQNDDIFSSSSEINTLFLPNVEFKILFSITDITENTKKTMWKYLQLIMITIMSSIKTSASFGDAASIFEGINEEELQSKLSETIEGLGNFFKNISHQNDAESETDEHEEFAKKFADGFQSPEMEKVFEEMFGSAASAAAAGAGAEADASADASADADERQNTFNFDSSSMPNVDELHGHIKGLFDGKIGSLAKELAEELSGEVMDIFNDDGDGEVKSTGDILKKMMKNPKQIMDLVKKISGKLDNKMKNGNISQEELMKEAGDLLSKMKGMGNGKEFQDMMKNMMKNMNPMMGAMMGGKNAKMDMNKVNNAVAKNTHKERMLKKLEEKRAQQSQFVLEKTNNPNEFVFKGNETQEKSSIKSQTVKDADDWLNEPITPGPVSSSSKKGKGNSKNNKKKK
jgi:ribosomal protein L12E/L44/L45/RPP1/RPP2